MTGWLLVAGCAVEMGGSPGGAGGEVRTEVRALQNFDAVRNDSIVDVVIEVGKPFEVTARASNLEGLITTVVGDVLVVETAPGVVIREDRLVTVSMPTIRNLKVDSTGDVQVNDLSGERFTVTLSSTGDATIDGHAYILIADLSSTGDLAITGLEETQVELRQSSTGDVTIAGRVTELSAELGSTGDLEVLGLDGGVRLDLGGTGDATLAGRITSLEAEVHSAGDLDARGLDAEAVRVTLEGTGDVTLAGRADHLVADVHSAGDLEAGGLHVANARVTLRGTGDATVHATDAVEGAVHSVGDLVLHGNATLRLTEGDLDDDVQRVGG